MTNGRRGRGQRGQRVGRGRSEGGAEVETEMETEMMETEMETEMEAEMMETEMEADKDPEVEASEEAGQEQKQRQEEGQIRGRTGEGQSGGTAGAQRARTRSDIEREREGERGGEDRDRGHGRHRRSGGSGAGTRRRGGGPGETERHSTGGDRKRALRPGSTGTSGPQAAVAPAASQAPLGPQLWPRCPPTRHSALRPRPGLLGPEAHASPALSDLAFGPRWAPGQEQRSIPAVPLVWLSLGLEGGGGSCPRGTRNPYHLEFLQAEPITDSPFPPLPYSAAGELGFWGPEVRAPRPRGLWEIPTRSHFLGTCSVPARGRSSDPAPWSSHLPAFYPGPSLPLQLLPRDLHLPHL